MDIHICLPQKLNLGAIIFLKKIQKSGLVIFLDIFPLSRSLGCVFLSPFPLKCIYFEGSIAHVVLIHVLHKMLLGDIYCFNFHLFMFLKKLSELKNRKSSLAK